MNPVRRQRLFILLFVVVGVSIAITLAMFALRQNINLFYSPSQIKAEEAPLGKVIRIGGLVMPGSVKRDAGSLQVFFRITDNKASVSISYKGILPDLFRENSGIVASGKLTTSGLFQANQILAKHDEKYMPPEVKKTVVKLHDAGVKAGSTNRDISEAVRHIDVQGGR